MPESQLVTIDGPGTRDIDDAIWVRKAADGGWVVTVAIAVPATLVAKGSPEDHAALALAATVYARSSAIKTMLPRAISEEQAALKVGTREAMVIEMGLGADLAPNSVAIRLEAVQITRRLTYEDVPALAREQDDLGRSLATAITVAQGLLARRRAAGALVFADLHRLLYLDEDGGMRQALSASDMVGHIVVQELMVLANTMVARWALERDIPFVFRSHQVKKSAPPPADLVQTILDMVARGDDDRESVQERVALIAGAASYTPIVLGHYALNQPFYAHCTSPLRRYVDLVNQRQISAAVAGHDLPYSQAEIATICTSVNDTLAQAKLDRSAHMKQKVIDRAARTVDAGRLDRLGEPELVQAIKMAARSGSFPVALAEHVAHKLEDNELADKVLDAIVEISVHDLPAEILQAWSVLLSQHPTKSKHLLMFAVQTGMADRHAVTDRPVAGGFAVTVDLRRIADDRQIEARATAGRKKDAENLASARVMCLFIGAPDFEVPTLTAAAAPQKAAPQPLTEGANRNFKGELLELCQKRKLAPPEFNVSTSGPPNDARFSCIVSLDGSEGSSEGLRTKKEAEAAAARALLEQLRDRATDVSRQRGGCARC
jgi:ribonuclease R